MAKNTETVMQEVIDREAIRNLPLQYCHCVWQKDLDGYANLFTEDGSFSTDDPTLPKGQGRAALKSLISGALDTMKSASIYPQSCSRTSWTR